MPNLFQCVKQYYHPQSMQLFNVKRIHEAANLFCQM